MPETELERVPHDGLLDLLAMCREEVPDRGANEVGAVGVEALLNQQIDVTKVHVAEVDRDLLAVARSFAQALNLSSHPSIHADGIWMLQGWTSRGLSRRSAQWRSNSELEGSDQKGPRLDAQEIRGPDGGVIK